MDRLKLDNLWRYDKRTYLINPERKMRYIRHSKIDLEIGLNAIKTGKKPKTKCDFGVSSLRLKTFVEKGTTCHYCGLEASHFALEKSNGSQSDRHHMNLWGVKNGNEVLFTHDHVHARALGGADEMSNAVTACEHCNSRKSKYENRILNEFRVKNEPVTVSFDTLIAKIKELYAQDHVLKFWFLA